MLSARPTEIEEDTRFRFSKTPGRTKFRKENTTHGGTVLRTLKGKQTPFQSSTHIEKAGGKHHAPLTTRRARPLGDKTPFPNRLAQLDRDLDYEPIFPISKDLKFSLLQTAQSLLQPPAQIADPDSAQRPSSARKHPKRDGQNFKTPANNGFPWAVDDISFSEAEPQVQEVAQNDYDEIEYMAPNTLDLPYQPPFDFDLPNYKEVGKDLAKLAFSFPIDDTPPAEIEINQEDIEPVSWDLLSLPDLEDDDDSFPRTRSSSFHPSTTSTAKKSSSVTNTIKNVAPKPISTTSTQKPSKKATAPATTSTASKTAGMRSRIASQKTTGAPQSSSRSRQMSTTTTSIPPRPATSTAVHRRVVSRTNTDLRNTQVAPRPATATSMYKTRSSTKAGEVAKKPVASSTFDASTGKRNIGTKGLVMVSRTSRVATVGGTSGAAKTRAASRGVVAAAKGKKNNLETDR